MAKQFLPGGLVSNIVNRATFDRESAMRRPTTADIIQARIGRMAGTAPKVPTVAEGAARESRLANTLRAYGLGTPATPTAAAGAALKPSATDTVSELLPSTGTPAMAGLGAAGRTMMQLGGWQDKPYTLGQILGAGAEKGIAAMKAQREAMAAAAEKKAAAERQVGLDELSRRNIESQIKVRETPPAFKPGTLYDFPVEGGTQKGYIDSGGKVVYVGGVKKPEDKKKPSSKLFAVNIPGEKTIYLRADDPILDDYLGNKGRAMGAVVTEAPKVVGTQSEVTPGLTKAAHAKMVESTFNAQNNIIELENVKAGFQDRFLTLQGKLSLAGAKFLDMLDSSKPEDKKFIAEQSRWKTDAWNQVNKYIKEITGAQMSEAEARRILNALPNPDSSIFKLTSPTEYKSQLETALRNAKMAVARQQYFLNEGLKPEYYKTSLPEEKRLGLSGFDVIYRDEKGNLIEYDDMPKIMDNYTDKIAAKYETDEYSNLTDDQKIAMINQEVNSYFGLTNTPGQGI